MIRALFYDIKLIYFILYGLKQNLASLSLFTNILYAIHFNLFIVKHILFFNNHNHKEIFFFC
jgi:hypothetical protein